MKSKSIFFLIVLTIVSGISIFIFQNTNYILYGANLSKEQQLDQAIKITQNNIKASNNDPQYVMQLAQVYENKEDYDKAIETYREVQKLEPKEVLPVYSIADLQMKIGEFDKALDTFNEVIKIDKNYNQAYLYMSLIYLLNDYTKAISYAQLAVDTKPSTDKSNYLENYVQYIKTIKDSNSRNERYNAFKSIISSGFLYDCGKLKTTIIEKTNKEFSDLPSLATIN